MVALPQRKSSSLKPFKPSRNTTSFWLFVTGSCRQQQSDLTEDFKGPAKKIALDGDGNFTKAAQGFVRGKGLTVEDILNSRNQRQEEYCLCYYQGRSGKPAGSLFLMWWTVLKSLTFPVTCTNNTFGIHPPCTHFNLFLDEEEFDGFS